jgi:hypothetical protein
MADNTLDKERRQVDLSRGVQKVTKPRFLMAEHIFEYSGGESAYETESAEDDEGRKYVRHRKIAGTEHELTKRRRAVPMRVRSAIPTQRPLPTPV